MDDQDETLKTARGVLYGVGIGAVLWGLLVLLIHWLQGPR